MKITFWAQQQGGHWKHLCISMPRPLSCWQWIPAASMYDCGKWGHGSKTSSWCLCLSKGVSKQHLEDSWDYSMQVCWQRGDRLSDLIVLLRLPEEPAAICNDAAEEHLSCTSVGSRTVTMSWRAEKVWWLLSQPHSAISCRKKGILLQHKHTLPTILRQIQLLFWTAEWWYSLSSGTLTLCGQPERLRWWGYSPVTCPVPSHPGMGHLVSLFSGLGESAEKSDNDFVWV